MVEDIETVGREGAEAQHEDKEQEESIGKCFGIVKHKKYREETNLRKLFFHGNQNFFENLFLFHLTVHLTDYERIVTGQEIDKWKQFPPG